VESTTEVTAPAVGQAHALLADDVESTTEVTAPAVGQAHALLADDVESTTEVTTPAASDERPELVAYPTGVHATFYLAQATVWSGVATGGAVEEWTNLAPTQTAVYTNATPSTGNVWAETTL